MSEITPTAEGFERLVGLRDFEAERMQRLENQLDNLPSENRDTAERVLETRIQAQFDKITWLDGAIHAWENQPYPTPYNQLDHAAGYRRAEKQLEGYRTLPN